jgi:hypothetical protein
MDNFDEPIENIGVDPGVPTEDKLDGIKNLVIASTESGSQPMGVLKNAFLKIMEESGSMLPSALAGGFEIRSASGPKRPADEMRGFGVRGMYVDEMRGFAREQRGERDDVMSSRMIELLEMNDMLASRLLVERYQSDLIRDLSSFGFGRWQFSFNPRSLPSLPARFSEALRETEAGFFERSAPGGTTPQKRREVLQWAVAALEAQPQEPRRTKEVEVWELSELNRSGSFSYASQLQSSAASDLWVKDLWIKIKDEWPRLNEKYDVIAPDMSYHPASQEATGRISRLLKEVHDMTVSMYAQRSAHRISHPAISATQIFFLRQMMMSAFSFELRLRCGGNSEQIDAFLNEPVIQFIHYAQLLFLCEDPRRIILAQIPLYSFYCEDYRLHSESVPAIRWQDSLGISIAYFIRGVGVSAGTVEAPNNISLLDIIQEFNTDARVIMIERFGWEKFLFQAEAALLDSVTVKAGESAWVEELVSPGALPDSMNLLVTYDPSTGRKMFLTVPSSCTTCAAAQQFLMAPDMALLGLGGEMSKQSAGDYRTHRSPYPAIRT